MFNNEKMRHLSAPIRINYTCPDIVLLVLLLNSLQKTFQVQGSCPEFARLWSVISKHTTPTSQSLGMLLASGGDPTKDSVYQIWQMRISDEAKYVAEYKKMQAARDEAGQINGVWGLVRLMAGSNEEYTHFAFQGSPDLSTHVTPVADNSIYMKFAQKVSDRTLNS